MPDVKIKGYSGNELHYADVPKVWLATEESTEDNPVLVPFTYGEALDGVEIVPDFSVGDMQITVPEGYLARSAVVKRPETLVPANIAKGVTIAGITGELTGGNIQFTYDSNGEVIAAKLIGFTVIPRGMFAYMNKLASVDLSESPGLTSIGEYAFYYCTALTAIELPLSVVSIEMYAFGRTGLTSINLHEGITTLGDYAFAYTQLASVIVPKSIATFGSYVFQGCTKLTSAVLSDGLTTMGGMTFMSCAALISVTIPNGIVAITDNAFYGCKALKSIIIPASVIKIAKQAFYNCESLTSAVFNDKTGWYVSTSGYSGGTSISVNSESTAATYLRSTYFAYYWYNSY